MSEHRATSLQPSFIRTLVPIILALAIKGGVDQWGIFDSVTLEYLAAGLATYLYYIGVRILERAKSSKWGWLLGYPAAPVYPAAK